MARCPEVNSSGCEPPFLPPSFPQSGTGFAPPISNFYSEISFIFAVNVLYLSCDCRTRLKKRRKRVSFWGSSAIAAYPRKGTITMASGGTVGTAARIAAYPRKGTITACTFTRTTTSYCSLSPQGDDNFIFCSSIILPFYCSLSPQGDDNLPKMPSTGRPSIAAYPRKGTITIPLRRSRPAPPLQLIPARGR